STNWCEGRGSTSLTTVGRGEYRAVIRPILFIFAETAGDSDRSGRFAAHRDGITRDNDEGWDGLRGLAVLGRSEHVVGPVAE
ncbi:MAG: hypothetical protein ACK6EB_04090, partial [Planctomyces sp.]